MIEFEFKIGPAAIRKLDLMANRHDLAQCLQEHRFPHRSQSIAARQVQTIDKLRVLLVGQHILKQIEPVLDRAPGKHAHGQWCPPRSAEDAQVVWSSRLSGLMPKWLRRRSEEQPSELQSPLRIAYAV